MNERMGGGIGIGMAAALAKAGVNQYKSAKSFASVADMEAYTGSELAPGDFVVINTGTDSADNGKLFLYDPELNILDQTTLTAKSRPGCTYRYSLTAVWDGEHDQYSITQVGTLVPTTYVLISPTPGDGETKVVTGSFTTNANCTEIQFSFPEGVTATGGTLKTDFHYINAVDLIKGIDPDAIEAAVQDWLDDHPEATTTVEDGAVSYEKLDEDLQETVDDVSELKSAIANKIDEPSSEGTSGQVLTTDGNGGRSWTTVQGGGSVTVDDAFSTSSTNPVQNKIITGAVNDIEDDVEDIQEILNGTAEPTITMPDGYKSASYSNAAGTLKFKWENNKLVLSKSNGSSGEINTGNASLTIGDSLEFDVIPSESPKLVFSYNNANEANIADLMLRFCRYDRYDYYDGVDIHIPVGEGSQEIDLVTLATSNNVNLTERYRLIIRGLVLRTGAQSYSTAIVYIDGYKMAGEAQDGLVDRVEDAEKTIKSIQDEIAGNAFLMRQNIPSYYFAAPVSPASFDDYAYIEDAIARVPEGKSFIYVTDTHWESNAKNTFKLIQYVKNRLGISKVLFGGDCIDRGNTKYIGLNTIREFMQEAVDALGGDFIPTIGNHDLNTGNALNDQLDYATYRIPYDQIYKVFLSRVKGITTEDWSSTISTIAQSDSDASELTGWTKLHYHVDDDENKTRYIVIYSSAYDGVIVPTYTGFGVDGGGGATTVMQYEWFADTLTSTPEGYDIIVLSHCADAENKTFPERQLLRNYFDFFVRIASAFHKKCSGYKIDVSNFDENGCPTNAFWTRETKQWDFSNAPDVGKILFVSGHIHQNVEYVSRITTDSTVYPTYDRGKARNNGNPALAGTVQDVEVFDSATVDFSTGEMLTIISQCDAYNRTTERYQYEHDSMTQGTVTEQSFDVITLTDSGVVCTRFGAGWDRTIPVKWLPTT